jgi:hypothetical protein
MKLRAQKVLSAFNAALNGANWLRAETLSVLVAGSATHMAII